MVSYNTLWASLVVVLVDLVILARSKDMLGCKNDHVWADLCPKLYTRYGKQICASTNRHIAMAGKHCLSTCGNCPGANGRVLSPPVTCDKTRHGCCWDNVTPAKGSKGKGCPMCRDDYKYTICKLFYYLCYIDTPNAKFFHMICPVSCGLCDPKAEIMGDSEPFETFSDVLAKVSWRKHSKVLKRFHLL